MTFYENLTRHISVVLISLSVMWGAQDSVAGDYPEKTVRLIVPFPPGGGTDTLARILGQKLSEKWKVAVVIDNRGGANGIVATRITAQANPDGYTLQLITAGHSINPSLYGRLPYNTVTEFAPVAGIASGAFALVITPQLPVRSVKDLVALAQSGNLNFASSGTGSPNHLACEMFKSVSNLDITHVPYRGAGPALTAVIAGQSHMAFGTMVSVPPLIKAGKLRGLAVSTAIRSRVMPELQTMIEAGVPNFDVSSWFGLVAPAGTPREVIVELNESINDILTMSDVQNRLASQALEPLKTTSQEFLVFINSEIKRWAEVVKKAGARVE